MRDDAMDDSPVDMCRIWRVHASRILVAFQVIRPFVLRHEKKIDDTIEKATHLAGDIIGEGACVCGSEGVRARGDGGGWRRDASRKR